MARKVREHTLEMPTRSPLPVVAKEDAPEAETRRSGESSVSCGHPAKRLPRQFCSEILLSLWYDALSAKRVSPVKLMAPLPFATTLDPTCFSLTV